MRTLMEDEIKRWTAKRKTVLVLEALLGPRLQEGAAGDMAPFDTVAEQLQQQAAQFAA